MTETRMCPHNEPPTTYFVAMTELVLPKGITLIDSPLPGIRVETPSGSGVVYFNGAHVAEWTPAGQRPVLWMSESSMFEAGKAIRGGVPIVWPWFATGVNGDQTPAHGIARLCEWHLRHAKVTSRGATLTLGLEGSAIPPGFAPDMPRDFDLEMRVSMGKVLILQLVLTNGQHELSIEEGLHTYFAVGDIHKVRVEGLDGAAYTDKVANSTATQQGDVRFTGETDRVYESRSATRIVDEEWNRTILVDKVSSAQTVVWNPWIAKAAAMPDFGDDEWTQMVCVEAVNTRDQSITVPPMRRHLLSQTVEVL